MKVNGGPGPRQRQEHCRQHELSPLGQMELVPPHLHGEAEGRQRRGPAVRVSLGSPSHDGSEGSQVTEIS